MNRITPFGTLHTMQIMKTPMPARLAALITTVLVATGCASTLDQEGLEQRTAQAIGRTPGQFTITDRKEETGGRINYTVNTRDGASYRCYVYGVTGFQKAMTFGQTPHSDAICTAMVGSAGNGGAQAPAAAAQPQGRAAPKECNALLRTAGRC